MLRNISSIRIQRFDRRLCRVLSPLMVSPWTARGRYVTVLGGNFTYNCIS